MGLFGILAKAANGAHSELDDVIARLVPYLAKCENGQLSGPQVDVTYELRVNGHSTKASDQGVLRQVSHYGIDLGYMVADPRDGKLGPLGLHQIPWMERHAPVPDGKKTVIGSMSIVSIKVGDLVVYQRSHSPQ